MKSKIHIFAGNANLSLAQSVAETAGLPLSRAEVFKFSNDNTFVKILDNVRGTDVFIIQPTCAPVNDNLMELLIMIDALHRASAGRITAVIPYYGYARSDKKDQPRVPITAKLVANLLTVAGANRVVTFDLHAEQIQGFFDIPVDHLSMLPIFLNYFKPLNLKNCVVVAPDTGGTQRARMLGKGLNATLAIGDKRRIGNKGQLELLNVVGEVEGKNTIIIDDIIDSGNSVIKMSDALKKEGAKKVYCACTHAVLSGDAVDRINRSSIHELIVTDSIPLSKEKQDSPKIKQLSIAPLLAQAIQRIHNEESVSVLFKIEDEVI
ncbi:MAG TPA: ribose-phosphate pyrophosphokinase [Candidatus Cloacimonetes bacterium]|nr:ribose-phosphate pyrophosphokinase [Candidatus Cloacimonadota bacterium]HEX38408.1 ribose-phosphate pyrophosphokinase [Candidatus Cloacimonadota bacterium]